MIAPSEITSLGPATSKVGYSRTGPSRVIALIRCEGIIGGGAGEVDSLDAEEAIDRAIREAEETTLVVLLINSRGGRGDEVEEILSPAIQRVRDAGGMCAAFIEGRAFGAAYQLAAECAPVVAHPQARVGFFGTQSPTYMSGVAERMQERAWTRIRKRRPQIDVGVVGKLADDDVSAEFAESFGLVDGISRLNKFLRGGCGRC